MGKLIVILFLVRFVVNFKCFLGYTIPKNTENTSTRGFMRDILFLFKAVFPWDIELSRNIIIGINLTSRCGHIFIRDRIMTNLFVVSPVYADSAFLPYGQFIEIDTPLIEELVFPGDAFTFKLGRCRCRILTFLSQGPVTPGIEAVAVSVLHSPPEIVYDQLPVGEWGDSAVENGRFPQLQAE